MVGSPSFSPLTQSITSLSNSSLASPSTQRKNQSDEKKSKKKKRNKAKAKKRIAIKKSTKNEAATKKGAKKVTRALSGPRGAQEIAKQQITKYGWSSQQHQCLVSLWSAESGWSPTAGYVGGSYGIPQANPGSKMASAGPLWRTDPATQIRWGLGYIKGRYGTPCGAWGHFRARHWY
jgi:hypothetical protein